MSRDFRPHFLILQPIKAPDKVFSNSVSISPRYSVIKLDIFLSVVECTPRRPAPWYNAQRQVSVEFRKSRKNRNKIRKYFSLFIRGPEVENLVNCQLVSWLPIARRSAAVHSRAGGVVTSLASCSALCTATRLS